MKGLTWFLTVALITLAAPLAVAQTELLVATGDAVTLPVKGRIAAGDGNAQLVFRVYDRARAGTLLHAENQVVRISRGIYYTTVGRDAAAALGSRRSVWVEVAAASAPRRPLGERQAFTLTREGQPSLAGTEPSTETHVPGAAALCFSCGGRWPIHTGSLINQSGGVVEYGGSCTNPFAFNSDTNPFLCTRRFNP